MNLRRLGQAPAAAVQRHRDTHARVVMLLGNNPYPQDPRVRREATALTAAGYRVAVICPRAPGEASRERVGAVEVHRYPMVESGGSFLGYVGEYGWATAATLAISLQILVRDGVDVVHAHNPPDTFVAVGAVHKLLGKRFVYDHHDLAPELYSARFGGRHNPVVRSVLVALERACCRLADAVITTNESHRKIEAERAAVPPEKITVVRNGPVLNRSQAAPGDGVVAAPGAAVPTIAYGGLIGRQDGADYLIRALHRLVFDLGRRDIRCVIVGDGDARPQVQRLAISLGLEPYIEFTGLLPYDRFLERLASADVCVEPAPSNPYNDRATTIKIMEYMALGKPVVAFDLPEHRVSADGAAAYVAANDERAMATTIARLLDDPAECRRMGEIGRRRVEGELAWQHSVPNLLTAYDALLDRRPKEAAR